MDWSYVHKVWDKWASNSVGSSGENVLKAALLINYDPAVPSRLLSTIAEQAGIKASPIEVGRFISFVRRNNLSKETFCLGPNEYLVTSIHGNWFHARCMNTVTPPGEGAMVIQTSAPLLPDKKKSEELKEIVKTIEYEEDESEEEKKSSKKRKRKTTRDESVEAFSVFSGSSITSENDHKRAPFLLVALYDGSIDAASTAMAAVDQFSNLLGRRNL